VNVLVTSKVISNWTSDNVVWSRLPVGSTGGEVSHLRLCLVVYRVSTSVFYIVSGDITQKGYEKKRAKLLLPYLSSQKAAGISGNIYLPLQLFGSLYCFIVFC